MRTCVLFAICSLLHNAHSFPVYKFVRVNYKMMKRDAARAIQPSMNAIVESESELIERSVAILSDNAVNEMLYLLKFYHMTNDTSSSFLYIITYEMIWVAYQIHKKNMLSVGKLDLFDEQSQELLRHLVLNVTLYIILKNMVINNIIAEINIGYKL